MRHVSVLVSFLLWQALHAQGADRRDLLQCRIERREFRQFCEVDRAPQSLQAVLETSKTINGLRFDFQDVLNDRHVVFTDTNGHERKIVLNGLNPHLKLDIDWNGHQACKASRLWQDRIQVHAVDRDGTKRYLCQVTLGHHHYDSDLSLVETADFSPWAYEPTKDGSQLTMGFVLKNADRSENGPLPPQRVPVTCTMNMSNGVIGFDSLALATDLQFLAQLAEELQAGLTQTYLLHGYIKDKRIGALCFAAHMGKVLRRIEGLGPAESWDSLSMTSQRAITDALRKADNAGYFACSGDGLCGAENAAGHWEFFKSAKTHDKLDTQCTGSLSADGNVDPKEFIVDGKVIDTTGLANAKEYVRYRNNLIKLMTAVLALASAGKLEIQTQAQLSWVIDPAIYQHLIPR